MFLFITVFLFLTIKKTMAICGNWYFANLLFFAKPVGYTVGSI